MDLKIHYISIKLKELNYGDDVDYIGCVVDIYCCCVTDAQLYFIKMKNNSLDVHMTVKLKSETEMKNVFINYINQYLRFTSNET